MSYQIRLATHVDVEEIALLHASSWKKAYRGLLSDAYLDNDLEGERKKYWAAKMGSLTSKEFVLVADNDDDHKIIGFAACLDKPEIGLDAFIDNLHVRWDLKGQGIGKQLMRSVADTLVKTARHSVYLWVLKGNDDAEKFYMAVGGQPAGSSTIEFGGKHVSQTRYIWSTLDALLH